MPIAAIVSPRSFICRTTSPSVSDVARQMSSGSCSTQPGRGKCCGNSRYECARGSPSSPTAKARTPVVPASMAITQLMRVLPARATSSSANVDARSLVRNSIHNGWALRDEIRSRRPRGESRLATWTRLSGDVYTRRRGRRVKNPVENKNSSVFVSTAKSDVRAASRRCSPTSATPSRASRRRSDRCCRPRPVGGSRRVRRASAFGRGQSPG